MMRNVGKKERVNHKPLSNCLPPGFLLYTVKSNSNSNDIFAQLLKERERERKRLERKDGQSVSQSGFCGDDVTPNVFFFLSVSFFVWFFFFSELSFLPLTFAPFFCPFPARPCHPRLQSMACPAGCEQMWYTGLPTAATRGVPCFVGDRASDTMPALQSAVQIALSDHVLFKFRSYTVCPLLSSK